MNTKSWLVFFVTKHYLEGIIKNNTCINMVTIRFGFVSSFVDREPSKVYMAISFITLVVAIKKCIMLHASTDQIVATYLHGCEKKMTNYVQRLHEFRQGI
jgi:hypothetical protein